MIRKEWSFIPKYTFWFIHYIRKLNVKKVKNLRKYYLNSKYKPSNFNRDNTIFRVNVHELAHSADKEFRGDGELAHGPFFYLLMDYLLEEAAHLGIYNCADYKRSNRAYCGLVLSESDSFCS